MTQPGEPHHEPPAPRRGPGVFVWLAIAGGAIYVLAGAGFVAYSAYKGYRKAVDQVAAQRLAAAGSAASPADEEAPAPGAHASLPPVTRHVPKHALALLDGCADGDLAVVDKGISEAIDVGAPLYNEGNFAGCYHMYEGAAVDIERRLGASCDGPRRALDAGRSRAATLPSAAGQAWAMRDAFDGLLDVIARRGRGI